MTNPASERCWVCYSKKSGLEMPFADVYFSLVPEILEKFPEHKNIRELSDDEQSRLEGITNGPARLSYYAAHILKRHALSKYAAVPPEEWKFATTRHGRPEITNKPHNKKIHFNISHCNTAVACIISDMPQCGIDLEDVRRKADLDAVAEEVFSTAELAHFRKMRSKKPSRDTLARHFFSIWCLKEAYMKALGMGFKINPKSFGFKLSGKSGISIEPTGKLKDKDLWQFYLSQPQNNFILATAIVLS
ncbi:MAG: 4'-phosphopantetheinyl transferase superfamily protein [Victivallales bacterium]|nr:4'-phosphopantetheinyl transferase superfamily protein [Victivallales bacterium]